MSDFGVYDRQCRSQLVVGIESVDTLTPSVGLAKHAFSAPPIFVLAVHESTVIIVSFNHNC